MTRPLIIVHRGLMPGGPENSLAASALAADAGADLIELDIRLSLDRQPVVMHDASVRRTTRRGHGWVRVLPAPLLTGMRLRADTGVDEHVPLLRAMLHDRPPGVELGLHLKDRRPLTPVLRVAQRNGEPARTWLWLERAEDVYTATRQVPELRCTLLRPGAQSDEARERYFIEAQFCGASAVSVPWGAVTVDVVRLVRQHNLKVFSVERSDLPFAPPVLVGVDGIITSDPRAARQRLASLGLIAKGRC